VRESSQRVIEPRQVAAEIFEQALAGIFDICQHATLDERQHAAGVLLPRFAVQRFDQIAVDRRQRGRDPGKHARLFQQLKYLVLAFQHRRRLQRIGDLEHVAAAFFADQEIQVALAVERLYRAFERKQPAGNFAGFGQIEIRKHATIGHCW
jgi:hypothetical protein